jgi:hypothetical protein
MLRTTITVTTFTSIRPHLRTCICFHDWCNGARAEHIFGNSSVALTSDILERPVWLVHLGLDANFTELPAYPRVWVGHFHWIDIQVVKGVNDESVFDKICLKFPTKFVEYETGNSSMLAPPRPSATKMEAQGSLFAKRTLSFEDYVLLSVDVHAKKRKKRSLPMPPSTASSGSTSPSSESLLRVLYWKCRKNRVTCEDDEQSWEVMRRANLFSTCRVNNEATIFGF